MHYRKVVACIRTQPLTARTTLRADIIPSERPAGLKKVLLFPQIEYIKIELIESYHK